MNTDFQMNFPIQGLLNQSQTFLNGATESSMKSLMCSHDTLQNFSVSHKLYKTGLYITSANIPQQMKANLIQNLLSQNSNVPDFQVNQTMCNPINQFYNTSMTINGICMNQNVPNNNPRVLFKKEEDEKIKKLVKIFGTRHWDLVAQFMEGRTAKQCRDRYSNYLIPGFFQGEWSDEEDSLLIKLYKENGPKWSIIQKSIPNRSANNIKNRWYYFLHKKVKSFEENEGVENKSNKNIESNMKETKKHFSESEKKVEKTIDELSNEKEKNDNIDFLFQQENEIYDCLYNIDNENNWILFE